MPIGLREAAEAAALDQAGDADRHAAAALHIAAAPGRHLVVGVSPDCAGPDRHRRLRLGAALAAGADEGVVQDDRVHMARPDEQRVGRVRRSLVAVAAALHHQPQVVLPGEIDGRDDIAGRLGGDRVDARPRRPGADPAERLRQPDLVAEIVRVLELLEDLCAVRIERSADAGRERRTHLDESAADLPVKLFPGRLGRPGRIAGADARNRGIRRGGIRRRRQQNSSQTAARRWPSTDACDSCDGSSIAP